MDEHIVGSAGGKDLEALKDRRLARRAANHRGEEAIMLKAEGCVTLGVIGVNDRHDLGDSVDRQKGRDGPRQHRNSRKGLILFGIGVSATTGTLAFSCGNNDDGYGFGTHVAIGTFQPDRSGLAAALLCGKCSADQRCEVGVWVLRGTLN